MKRILIAFGDSHTSGAEIKNKWDGNCYEKAYPAYIAKYYNFEYLNYGQCGGSNDWTLKNFYKIVPSLVSKGHSIFVICNFTEVSRTFIVDDVDGQIHHVTTTMFQPEEYPELVQFEPPEQIIKKYEEYLKNNSDKNLHLKTFLIIKKIQNYCKENNIPFLFHTSINWFPGDWTGIDKKNFYGHHDSDKTRYSYSLSDIYGRKYSYWYVATHHPRWKHIGRNERWNLHYPEEFHRYWAANLIKFINDQKLLEGYI
jgi:hypothetical protein